MSERAAALFDDPVETVKQRSLWIDALERLARNKMALTGMVIAVVAVFIALFAPYLAPYDYLEPNVKAVKQGPSREHWMGTDQIGRDLMSRLMWGARTALLVAVVVLTLSNVVGIVLGAIAAYVGGVVDDIIMRLADMTLSWPDLLFAAFLSTVVRRPVVEWVTELQRATGWGVLEQTIVIDYLVLFAALSFIQWAGVARLIRGQILSLREQEFIRAERALGVPEWLIIRRHLIPNAMAPIIVGITLNVGGVMLAEASLSFLGLGVQPPGASWGNMIASSLSFWRLHPHLIFMPGLALAIIVFGFNFLGDGINDALNPRQIKR